MASVRSTHSRLLGRLRVSNPQEGRNLAPRRHSGRNFLLFAAIAFLAHLVLAQAKPQVTTVDPASGKVNDNVTLIGDNLGKDSVSNVFLSDDNNDYKATVVDQQVQKIVMKVPQVKPGDYHVSIQVGDKIFILPLRFKVE